MAWKSSFRQNYRTTFSPTVPTSAAGISHVVADVEAPGGEKWEHLKSGGKQWQATPKNLPRMQRTRAIPVAWLNSGLCPDWPKGWIPVIIIVSISLFVSMLTVWSFEDRVFWGWTESNIHRSVCLTVKFLHQGCAVLTNVICHKPYFYIKGIYSWKAVTGAQMTCTEKQYSNLRWYVWCNKSH